VTDKDAVGSHGRHDAAGRAGRSLHAILLAVGVLAAAALTWRTSGALFSAATANGPDSVATGSVTVSDDDAGSALFSITGMTPGSTRVACVRVSYTGTLPSAIRVYATGTTATNALDAHLKLQIEEGSSAATTFPSCRGFVTSATVFNATLDGIGATYGTGHGGWAPSGAAAKDYRVTYTLSSAAPAGTVNSTASATFTWEAQSS
jgi:hypothetical protein